MIHVLSALFVRFVVWALYRGSFTYYGGKIRGRGIKSLAVTSAEKANYTDYEGDRGGLERPNMID